jgi:hypothetical protein
MSSEAAFNLFRSTRPFFNEFIPKGAPSFFGVDKRIAPFAPVAHYLARGSPFLLADRNWRSVANDSEDFGTDELYLGKVDKRH